jgi:regulator of sigma E protease
MQVLLFILAVILFIGLVLIHEWGHFIVARRNGVEAEEFGLFFPPRIVGKKLKSGMVLSLNWLPLGGFVKLKGEHDNDSEPGSFGAASLVAKTKILLAGVGMNLLAGLVILTILGWVGMPVLINKDLNGREQFHIKSDTHISRQQVEVADVVAGSPASKIGLAGRDTIERISGGSQTYQIQTIDDIHRATKALAGQRVNVTYKHAGDTLTRQTRLNTAKTVQESNGTKGYLGVALNQLTIWRSGWSAPINALGFTWQLIVLTFEGIGHALAGLGSLIAGLVTQNHVAQTHGASQAEGQVGGPVAIMEILWGSGSLGINFVLVFIAIISLTLALMNVLPIPALDGGRLFMTLFSRGVLKRPLTQAMEERIVGAGMLVVLSLIVLITIVDIKRFF